MPEFAVSESIRSDILRLFRGTSVASIRYQYPPAMLRRLSALIGMVVLVAILIALVWAVHEHRARTIDESVETDVRLDRRLATPGMEGERPC